MVLLMIMLSSEPVSATPPTEIALEYNSSTDFLFVNITHIVPNPKNHYIETVEVQKNNVFYENKTFSNQSSIIGQITNFTIPAVGGDNLTVIAICSRGDSLATWMIVPTTTSTTTTSTSTTTTGTSTSTTGTTSGTTTTDTEPTDSMGIPGGVALVIGIGVVLFIALLIII
ncbi:MAG: hypothetical protein ACFE7R_09645, partial [Candidatus Hodarchaeota archaeon]